jgi:hypothetical protein
MSNELDMKEELLEVIALKDTTPGSQTKAILDTVPC